MRKGRFNRRIPLVLLLLLAGVALLVSSLGVATNSQAITVSTLLPPPTVPPLLNPKITASWPANGATGIPYNPGITVTFDKDMDQATLTSATFYIEETGGNPLPATITYIASAKLAWLTPQNPLEPGATYVVTLTAGVKGTNGLSVTGAPVVWSFTTVSFTDVSLDTPYAVAISRLAFNEVISGFADHSFRPNDLVKRMQFAKMIVRAMNLPVTVNDICPFTDVPANLDPTDPLYPDHYVAVCAAKGITQGRTASLFAPSDSITRFQLISMVVRAMETLYPASVKNPPIDYQSTWNPALSPQHGQNARVAEYNHYLAGLPLASLNPWAPIPRGEVAQILYNAMTQGGPGA